MRILRNTAVRLAMIAFVLFFLIFIIAVRMSNNELDKKAALLQAKIDAQTEEIEALRADLDRPFNDEYIEKVAHENGYRHPQEIVYYSGDFN